MGALRHSLLLPTCLVTEHEGESHATRSQEPLKSPAGGRGSGKRRPGGTQWS